jgi:hypothetical protein
MCPLSPWHGGSSGFGWSRRPPYMGVVANTVKPHIYVPGMYVFM